MQHRHGFTLLELLVVIAIIGVLCALIVPAVQKARAAAARLECVYNLKQIGIAAHAYHGAHGAFPPGMRYRQSKDPMRLSSWQAQVLPFVEQQPLWNAAVVAYKQSSNPFQNPPHTPMTSLVAVYACPSDGRVSQIQFAPQSKFFVALTSYLGVSGKDFSTLDGVLFRDSRVRFADIRDGTSSTLFAGERPPSTDYQFGWWYAGVGQKSTGSGDMILGVEEQNLLPVTAGSCAPGTYKFAPGSFNNQCDMFHFWSPHSGGAHFLMADGSVHFLRYTAAPLLPALASRAGGEPAQLEP